MSYTLYHGCIESAIEPIINGEYGVEKSTPIVHPWTCANGNDIFFHDKELFKRYEGLEYETEETVTSEVIRKCNEQSQIQNACLKRPLDKTCVLECTFLADEEGNEITSWKDIARLDDSCNNMDSAVCMSAKYFRSLVKDRKVTFKVHEFPFYLKLTLFYIAWIAVENSLFNQACLSSDELDFCRKILEMDYYMEGLLCVEESISYEIDT